MAWMIAVASQIRQQLSPFEHSMKASYRHTRSRSVLAEVLGLVSSDQSLGLQFRSWATRKFFVEADYTLHAGGILGGTDSLFPISLILHSVPVRLFRLGIKIRSRMSLRLRMDDRELTVGEATYYNVSR